MPLDISLLREAGEAMHGERWQSELARRLPVGARRVREWVLQERSIPAWVWPRLRELLGEQGRSLAQVRRKLPR